jgi:hypothetical protein
MILLIGCPCIGQWNIGQWNCDPALTILSGWPYLVGIVAVVLSVRGRVGGPCCIASWCILKFSFLKRERTMSNYNEWWKHTYKTIHMQKIDTPENEVGHWKRKLFAMFPEIHIPDPLPISVSTCMFCMRNMHYSCIRYIFKNNVFFGLQVSQ